MKHLGPLMLAAALLAGCTEPRAVVATATATVTATSAATPSATATASATGAVPSAVPTSSPVPSPRAWDVPPPTGVAHVDRVINAMVAGDAAALAPLVIGERLACGGTESAPCPRGVPAGTQLSLVIGVGVGETAPGVCLGGRSPQWLTATMAPDMSHEEWTTPLAWATWLIEQGARYLRGVYTKPGSEAGSREYIVVFQQNLRSTERGASVIVREQGVVRAINWTGFGCAAVDGTQALLAPPPQSP